MSAFTSASDFPWRIFEVSLLINGGLISYGAERTKAFKWMEGEATLDA
jgi:hypothetical protein